MINKLYSIISIILFSSCTTVYIKYRTIEDRITWYDTDEHFVIAIHNLKCPKQYKVFSIDIYSNKHCFSDSYLTDSREQYRTITFDKTTFYIHIEKKLINDYIDSDYHFKKRYYEINYPDMVYPYLPFRFDEVYTVKAALWQNVWYNLGGWSKQKRYIQTGAPENWEIR